MNTDKVIGKICRIYKSTCDCCGTGTKLGDIIILTKSGIITCKHTHEVYPVKGYLLKTSKIH